jgi:hypothetical protein
VAHFVQGEVRIVVVEMSAARREQFE